MKGLVGDGPEHLDIHSPAATSVAHPWLNAIVPELKKVGANQSRSGTSTVHVQEVTNLYCGKQLAASYHVGNYVATARGPSTWFSICCVRKDKGARVTVALTHAVNVGCEHRPAKDF